MCKFIVDFLSSSALKDDHIPRFMMSFKEILLVNIGTFKSVLLY